MACRKDIQKAIYDKISQQLTEGRFSFDRVAEDTIQVNNFGKAKSKEQALAMGKSIADRASKLFNGHVKGDVSQKSVYDPVTIRFRINPAYVNYEYAKLSPTEQTDTRENLSPDVNTSLEDKYKKRINRILEKDKPIDEQRLKDKTFNFKYGFNFYNDIEDLRDGKFELTRSNAPRGGAQGGTLYTLKLKNRLDEGTASAENNSPGYIVVGGNNRIRYITVDSKYRKLGIATLMTKLYRDQTGKTGFSLINNPNIFKLTEKLGGTKVDDVTTDIPARGENLSPEEEAYQISTNTGPNTVEHLNPESIDDTPVTVGYFTKFITLKKQLLKSAREKLNLVNQKINSTQTSTTERVALSTQKRKLREEIEGVHLKNVEKEGLEDEIRRLENSSASDAVGYYVTKDLDRLDRLSESDNIDDLNDAIRLIDFYENAGKFEDAIVNKVSINPFFSKDDIFKEGTKNDFLLAKEIRDKFKEWASRAVSYKTQVRDKIMEVSVSAVNSNIAVQKTYGDKQFDFEEITSADTGLKDTDFVSMWTMDITQGIFSKNGILPQVMFSELKNVIEDDSVGAGEIAKAIDDINPQVIKRLGELNQSLKALGILGSDAVTYQLFKEQTKNGFDTGNFVMKFNREFNDAHDSNRNKFWKHYNDARALIGADEASKRTLIKGAFKDLRDWRRKNTVAMDTGAIPEIINDDEFSQFTTQFNKLKADNHRAELVKLLGEKEYARQVEEQKKLLREYAADRQAQIDWLMDSDNVLEPKDMSSKSWDALEHWDKQNNPFVGAGELGKVIYDKHVDSFNKYNLFLPRRNTVTLKKDQSGYNYTADDNNESTGYYNENYEKYIENDDVLGKFHDLLLESNRFIKESLTYEQQLGFANNSLPAMQKSFSEIIADRTGDTNILRSMIEAFKHLWEQIRLSFGVQAQSEQSYTTKNPITGRAEYKVNDSFIANNERAIQQRMLIENAKFNQSTGGTLGNVSKYTTILLSKLKPDSLLLLAEYLGVKLTVEEARTGRIDAIKAVTGENVSIGRIIRDYSMHNIVQAYSFDLAKLVKHGSYVAAMYSARNKALPVLAVMKNHYESIKDPKLTNISKQLFNIPDQQLETEGNRENAKKQIEDWFQRVVLGNYGLKHTGVFGKKGTIVDKTIYSKEDKKTFNELKELIKNEKDDKVKTQLINTKDKLGKTRTATALFDNVLAWVRTLRLGYNLSSGISNYIEGWASNMVMAATGEYYDPNEIYYAYAVTRSSFLKNAASPFGNWEPGSSRKNRILMDRFRVLMDTANELQKDSVKTLSNRLEALHPHTVNSRVEFNNQSPVMIAMLRTLKIKSIDGTKESKVWDAYDRDGKLMDEYRSPENLENWEELKGVDYKNFKEKLSKALVLAHGNYDTMRGMMAKSTTAGKAVLMFKSWIPQQLYWRFAVEQDDIQSGNKGFKGKYLSYGAGSGFVHGAVVGTAIFGPMGSIIGGALGSIAGAAWGTDSGVNVLKETLLTTWVLAKKMVGMPINSIAGRGFVDTSGKEFDKWVTGGKFSQKDANALKANMSDIGMQLLVIGLILAAKGLFWDDDDKKDDPERIAHNIIVNRLMQYSSQAGMYVNPNDIYKTTVGSNAVIQYLTDVGKLLVRTEALLEGRDIIQSGINAGHSGLWIQTKRTLIPGIFKFETQIQQQYQKSPFDEYFKSDEAKEKESNKRERASRKLDLEDQYKSTYPDHDEREKEVHKQLDIELPTPAKLKKLDMTREEYKESLKDQ